MDKALKDLDVQCDLMTLPKIVSFMDMAGDYTLTKIKFVNVMNFLITKFNPDAAKHLDKGPVPNVKAFKKPGNLSKNLSPRT